MLRLHPLVNRFLTILSIIIAAPSLAHAAAWTIPEDEIATFNNLFYYSTNAFYNEDRQLTSQTRYTKYEYNLYAEYGLQDDITLGFSGSLDAVNGNPGLGSNGGNVPDRIWNHGISDPSLFARFRLWQDDASVIAIQPWIKLPSNYLRDGLPRGGSEQTDLELRLLGGHSFQLWGNYHFINLESAYRKRLSAPSDQMRLDATLGIKLNEQWMVMPQLFSTWRLDRSSQFTQNSADDYNLIKPQLSVVYSFSDDTQLQLGGFHHSYGQNTGAGGGALLSLWVKL